MNPGPMDERGSYNPELATMTYREALRKGWIRRPEKCPPFWRPALQKVIKDREELINAAELARRMGITDKESAALAAERMKWNEKRLKDRYPGWC